MKKFISVKLKLVLFIVPILALLYAFISTVFLKLNFNFVRDVYVGNMRFTAANLARSLSYPVWIDDKESVEQILGVLQKKETVKKIQIILSGEEYYSWTSKEELTRDKEIVIEDKIVPEVNPDMLLFNENPQAAAVFRIGLSEKAVRKEIRFMNYFNGFVLLIGLILFLVAYFFVESITGPIIELNEQVQEISLLNFHKKISIQRNDEIGMLAESFENMRKEIVSYSRRIEDWNKELERRIANQTEELNAKNEELQASVEQLEVLNEDYRQINEKLNKTLLDLSEAKERAEESNQMKSQFVSMMSHELRTPLTSIIGYTQLISTGILGDITAKQKDSLSSVENSAKDLLRLINDIIDVSKIDLKKFTLNREKTNIKSFIKDVTEEFKSIISGKKLEFIENSEFTAESAYFDELRIKQVVNNLLINAFKFTDSGSITLDIKQVNSLKYSEKSTQNGNYLQFSVQDTGVGINPKEIEKIWNIFYQVDNKLSRKAGGTGLGLTISKQLVQLHRGRFFVESKPGKGSRFSFIIPIKGEEDT